MGSPLVQKRVQDCQICGHLPSYRPDVPGRGKIIFCRRATHLIQMWLCFWDRKYLLQMEYGSWPKGKNKRKRAGERKRHNKWKIVPFARGGKSRGSGIGRPSSGGYLFWVRGYRSTFFRWKPLVGGQEVIYSIFFR